MAAASPAAVAISASEIPGATTARLAEPLKPIPLKDSIIPQTVPKSPMKGAVLPVVAKKDNVLSSLLPCWIAVLFNALSIFSDIPFSPGLPSFEEGVSWIFFIRISSVYPALKS